jgi:cell wall-associated NlpC family hydrolase
MRRAAIVALVSSAAACGLFQSKSDELREDIVDTAMDQVGEDYRYGGADPDDGFDCSGLVYFSYGKSGIELPRSAASQRKGGRPIRFADAKPADLLFYNFADRKKGDLHVVMFIGGGRGVHAPVRDGEVEVVDLTKPQWKKRYVGAVRYLKDE